MLIKFKKFAGLINANIIASSSCSINYLVILTGKGNHERKALMDLTYRLIFTASINRTGTAYYTQRDKLVEHIKSLPFDITDLLILWGTGNYEIKVNKKGKDVELFISGHFEEDVLRNRFDPEESSKTYILNVNQWGLIDLFNQLPKASGRLFDMVINLSLSSSSIETPALDLMPTSIMHLFLPPNIIQSS